MQNYIIPILLKAGLEKGKRKATDKGQMVTVELAYWSTAEHSISVTDPQPFLGKAASVSEEKQLQFPPVPFLGAGQQEPLSLWNISLMALAHCCTPGEIRC